VLLGPMHIALAACSVRYARLVARLPSEELLLRGQRDWSRALVFVTLAAFPFLTYSFARSGPVQFPVLALSIGYLPTALLVPFVFNLLRSHVVEERRAIARPH
jgi:hypothetical protein